jgi:hypothetical protein
MEAVRVVVSIMLMTMSCNGIFVLSIISPIVNRIPSMELLFHPMLSGPVVQELKARQDLSLTGVISCTSHGWEMVTSIMVKAMEVVFVS